MSNIKILSEVLSFMLLFAISCSNEGTTGGNTDDDDYYYNPGNNNDNNDITPPTVTPGNLYFDIDNGNRDKYYVFTSESDIELLQNYVNKHLTIETEYKSNYYVKIFRAEGVALFNVKIIESSEPTRLIWLIGEVYMDPNQWID